MKLFHRKLIVPCLCAAFMFVTLTHKAEALVLYALKGETPLHWMRDDAQIFVNLLLVVLFPPYGLLLEENATKPLVDALPFLKGTQEGRVLESMVRKTYQDSKADLKQQHDQFQQTCQDQCDDVPQFKTKRLKIDSKSASIYVVLKKSQVRAVLKDFPAEQVNQAVQALCK